MNDSHSRLLFPGERALAPYVQSFGKHIPIIAGGGFHREDLYGIMKLGADAVQWNPLRRDRGMRRRHPFQASIVDCTEKDIGSSRVP